MSFAFEIRTKRKSGQAPVQVRIQLAPLGINVRLSTGLTVPLSVMEPGRINLSNPYFKITTKGQLVAERLEVISAGVNSLIGSGQTFSSKEVKDIVDAAVMGYTGHDASVSLPGAPERGTDLDRYIAAFIRQIESGERMTEKGTCYAKGTVQAFRQALSQFLLFEQAEGTRHTFSDIDMQFYHSYTAFLKGRNYSINSIGKCINFLKIVLSAAEADGLNSNTIFRNRHFKGSRIETDAIYLTQADLDALMAVDLSSMHKCYDEARDLFMLGVCTAQRVSDYNNISRNNIREVIVSDEDGARKITVIDLHQKKTGRRVSMPVSTRLMTILEKYDFSLPHLWDQKINRYIKIVAQMAGIDEMVETVSTAGGAMSREFVPKYSLITTHTARRTGATLMYLNGMDIFDIMKVTGHSSVEMLRKYIKADSLEIAVNKLTKYGYFK